MDQETKQMTKQKIIFQSNKVMFFHAIFRKLNYYCDDYNIIICKN